MLTQVIDIVLNFFKIDHVRKRAQQDPFEIFTNYVKGNFVVDLIAVVPYSIVYPPFMILRYLKLLKFNTYLMYFEEFVFEFFSYLNPEQIKFLKDISRLIIQVIMVSHFFACLWVLIGEYYYEEH